MAGEGLPYPEAWAVDVALADGGTVHLRPMRGDDGDRLVDLYDHLSAESLFQRFFSPVPAPTARDLERLTDLDYAQRYALVAELGERVVAAARYALVSNGRAEVAFTVADDQQGRGIATVMLEHLAAYAQTHGIEQFVAVVLASNTAMLDVFADAGFGVRRTSSHGEVDVVLDLRPSRASIRAREHREQVSEARSVARILAPSSIAVIGASRRADTIGNGVLRNLLAGDFAGPVYPINPNASSVAGVAAHPDLAAVPGPVDLAVVCVRAELVDGIVDDCIRKGVRGLVVISAGFAELGGEHRDAERALVRRLRANGIRMIGPNCMGVVNTAPGVQMNATFAPDPPVPGHIAFASQSGGLGIELLAESGVRDLGISSFVSLGNKADVSSNDLLQLWGEDPDTHVVLLYLESFGNPTKFARLAREVGRTTPIIAVKSGRTVAGARGTSSHTAALAAPDDVVDTLLHEAGVIRVDTLEELFDTASIAVHQPLPRGPRVAIVSNGGGPGILAADACVTAGLQVDELSAATQDALRAVVSPDGSVSNPIDLVASASADVYRATLDILVADPDVDALLVIFVPPLVTRADDVAAALVAAAARATDTTITACFLGRTGVLPRSDPGARTVPTYAFPEAAAGALGRVARHAAWRSRPAGVLPSYDDIDEERARAVAEEFVREHPDGGWAPYATVQALLAAFGIATVPSRVVATAEEAADAAAAFDRPVALKAASPALVHKTDVGGVALELATPDATREAFSAMHERLGDTMGGAVVQVMADEGVEMIVGCTRDPLFGPLVLVGLGGVQAELLRDTALRFAPLTDQDAHDAVRSLRGAPLLLGYRNRPPADVAALEEVVLRVGLLAAAVPELVELDANPVLVGTDGARIVDLRARLAPAPAGPPGDLRRLRG